MIDEKLINQEHKQIIYELENLLSTINLGQLTNVIKQFKNIFKIIKIHFKTEEIILKNNNSPLLIYQKEDHKNIKKIFIINIKNIDKHNQKQTLFLIKQTLKIMTEHFIKENTDFNKYYEIFK